MMRVVCHSVHPNQPLPVHVPNTVDVLVVRLTDDLAKWAESREVLSSEEHARADRYKLPRPRQQFVTMRTLLRLVLADRLACAPGKITLTVTSDGKPSVVGAAGIEFNVTHTDGLGLIAIGPTVVGIDVERLRPMPNADGLVDRYFDPGEREQYRSLPESERERGFFQGWICKEAILKAVGCGARGLEGCVVELDPRLPPRIRKLTGPAAAKGTDWSLAVWTPDANYLAALAVQTTNSLELVAAESPPR